MSNHRQSTAIPFLKKKESQKLYTFEMNSEIPQKRQIKWNKLYKQLCEEVPFIEMHVGDVSQGFGGSSVKSKESSMETNEGSVSVNNLKENFDEEKLKSDAKQLVEHLFTQKLPFESRESVIFDDITICTDGITNKLLKVTVRLSKMNNSRANTNDRDPKSSRSLILLVRCYGRNTHKLIDRNSELVSIYTLSRLPCEDPSFPYSKPLYCRFSNGFIYGYQPGRVLTSEQLSVEDISMWIARMMGRWHREVNVVQEYSIIEEFEAKSSSEKVYEQSSASKPHSNDNSHYKRSRVWGTMRKWLSQLETWSVDSKYIREIPSKYEEELKKIVGNPEILFKHIDHLEASVPKMVFSPIVYCHNDLQSANIIYHPHSSGVELTRKKRRRSSSCEQEDSFSSSSGGGSPNETRSPPLSSTKMDSPPLILEDDSSLPPAARSSSYEDSRRSSASDEVFPHPTTQISFIDFEYSSYSYRAFDIANHFNEFAGFECIWARYPNLQQQIWFCKNYLEEYHSESHDLIGQSSRQPSNNASQDCFKVTDAQVSHLLKEISHYQPISHLYWGIWAMVQHQESCLAFDYLGYACERIGEYLRTGAEMGILPSIANNN